MSLTHERLAHAEALLIMRAGLMLDGPGRSRLARAIEDVAEREHQTCDAVVEAMATSGRVLDDILAAVSVHETAFFRDLGMWVTLAGTMLPALVAASRGRTLTVWSAGAAHGQEAYSMAILLEELGCEDYRIVASDLSPTAVGRIASGRYSERELRGLSPARREHWFTRHADGAWTVKAQLRARVTPVLHNITLTAPPLATGSCALILCRYVMIYLTPAATGALLSQMARLLLPAGRLVIGAAESLAHISDAMIAEPYGDTFLYRPRTSGPSSPLTSATAPWGRLSSRLNSSAPPRPLTPRPLTPDPLTPDPLPLGPAAEETAAARGPSVDQASALLAEGERAFARGDLQAAVSAFRAAGYLDPDSPIPPLQLGLALEAIGDPGAGRAFAAAQSALAHSDLSAVGEALGGYRTEELAHLIADKLEPGS